MLPTKRSFFVFSRCCSLGGVVLVHIELGLVRILQKYLQKLSYWDFLALNLKEIPYEIKSVSLIKDGGEQLSNEFRVINPIQKIPALQIDGVTLVESLSILSYLEETRPQKALLPLDAVKRAKVCLL